MKEWQRGFLNATSILSGSQGAFVGCMFLVLEYILIEWLKFVFYAAFIFYRYVFLNPLGMKTVFTSS